MLEIKNCPEGWTRSGKKVENKLAATRFLKSKGIIVDDHDRFLFKNHLGQEFDVVQLLEEFKSPASNDATHQFNNFLQRMSMIKLDLMADDFHDCVDKLKTEAATFFTTHPNFDNQENRKLLGM